jgi:hypothetical protein
VQQPITAAELCAAVRARRPRALQVVRRVLRAHGGAITHAAAALGIAPSTLHRWLATDVVTGPRLGRAGAASRARVERRRIRRARARLRREL